MSEFDKIADPVGTVDNFKTLACALESKIYLGRAEQILDSKSIIFIQSTLKMSLALYG
jgi:hypothetical protein